GVAAQVELAQSHVGALRAALRRRPTPPFVNVWHKQPPVTLKATPWETGPTAIRTMFETDSIPASWLPALERVDAVYVPSRFNAETFASAGVPEHKLRVLPPPIDLRLFDPARAAPLARPRGARRFCFLSVFEVS